MIEVRRILCPVDFSEFSRHALYHALSLARWYDARVTVFHTYSAPTPIVPAPGIGDTIPAFPPVRPEEVTEEVRRFCGASISELVEIQIGEGTPTHQIVALAERLPADLIVMGTHGRSGLEHLLLGSVTERVLRTTHVPVLTVPPPVEEARSPVYKTILCPLEFSDASLRALEFALSLAEETDARVILLHVVEGAIELLTVGDVAHLSVPEYYRQLQEDALQHLKRVVPEEARVWCKPDERVATGKAYREILRVAQEENVELIVMGAHGKGVLNRRLLGSTTHQVIRQARCPVLTLRG